MKSKLTKDELIDQLNSQLNKIDKYCKSFDEGDESVASEIAVKLRILFHNSNSSKSLLRHLKLEHINFFDTASPFNSKNLLTHFGLALTEVTWLGNGRTKSIITPKLDRTEKRNVNFENWWDGKKMIQDKFHNAFTRRKIILELADTDGGAHVDNSLNEDYKVLTRENSIDRFNENENGDTIPINPIPASIRQIAFETLITFRNIDIANESKLYK